MPTGLLDLGLIDGQNWGAAHVDAVEAAINTGPVICTSTTRPAGVVGRTIWETDKQRLWVCTVAGTPGTWVLIAGRMGFTLRRNASQSIPNGGWTDISWDTEGVDTDNTVTVPTTVVTVPTTGAGVWSVTVMIAGPANWAFNSGYGAKFGGSLAELRPAAPAGGESSNVYVTGSLTLPLSAGDTISLAIYNNSGSAKNFTAWLWAYRVSH